MGGEGTWRTSLSWWEISSWFYLVSPWSGAPTLLATLRYPEFPSLILGTELYPKSLNGVLSHKRWIRCELGESLRILASGIAAGLFSGKVLAAGLHYGKERDAWVATSAQSLWLWVWLPPVGRTGGRTEKHGPSGNNENISWAQKLGWGHINYRLI